MRRASHRRQTPPQSVLAAAVLGLAVGPLTPAVAAPPEAPTVELIRTSRAVYLNDTQMLHVDPRSGIGELRSSEARTLLGPGDRAGYAGSTVDVTTRSERGMSVSLLDRKGYTIWSTWFPTDSRTVPFGEAIAVIPDNDHEPGMPYSLRVRWAGGEVALNESDRTIVDLMPLERHLVIASFAAGGEAARADVIDARAERRWSFESASEQRPRVAVDGERAVAIVPGHPVSTLHVSAGATGSRRRTRIAGWMTDTAFLTDGSGIVVWGPRHIALVGLGAANVVWALELPGHGRQLANDTSYVSVVGGTLATLTRRQRHDASWEVEAHFIDAAVGSIIGRRKLLEASEMPVGVRRFPRGETERLVFRHHVFELSPPAPPEHP